jgi:hypothetical protein
MARSPKEDNSAFTKEETARRLDAIMRGAFSGSPKTYEESKLSKPREKPGKSPAKRKTVKKSAR